MATAPKRVTLREPGVAGSYELVECRADGSLLLRPERERLSDVLRETDGQVSRDEEFAAHLERVVASEDDLVVRVSSRARPTSR
jgi:nicotinamide riboside kinase